MSTPVDRLRELIRIPTVSRSNSEELDWEAFAAFRAKLAELFPLVHERLEHELVGEASLFFRWAGRDAAAAPLVLMAHQDVVPADEPGWQFPAFEAELVRDEDGEERVRGRGAIDDKGALGSILEAVESRLAEGFTPAADVYLAFGYDEEVAGHGAPAIVDLLEQRGIRPALVVDEGGAVVEGIFPGVNAPVAVVGVSEKGLAGIELSVERSGGHASTPVRDGATTRLARAIVRLDRSPAPAQLAEPTAEMIRRLGAHTKQPMRFLFTHVGLFRGLLTAVFSRLGPETNAMVRTTYAVTRLRGSAGDNVIAEKATAMVNVRIAVGSSLAEALAHIQRVVHRDGVEARLVYGSEPSPVSPASGEAWERLSASIGELFPEAIVTPYVMLQASDGRHFTRISEHVYRFLPFDLTTAGRATRHAIDESIRVSTYLRGIDFFRDLLARS